MVYAIILIVASLVTAGIQAAEFLKMSAFVDYQWWHYVVEFLSPALLLGSGIWKLAEAIKDRWETKKFLEGLPKDEESESPN